MTIEKRGRATALLLTTAVLVAACGGGDGGSETANPANGPGCIEDFDRDTDYFADKVAPSHSELWDIEYRDSYKIVTIPNVEFPEDQDLRYVLVRCGAPQPELTGDLEGAPVFTVPVQRTMVEHANSLAMLDALGVTSTIVGMSDALLQKAGGEWYDRVIADAGDPTNIGGDANGEGFDYEAMLGLEADLMINGGYGSSYQYSRPQVEAGIPAVLGSNRIEATPLASAEWIKFFAAFYDAEAKANAIFDGIEERYDETAAIISDADLGIEAAYLCMGREAGCEFMYAHGAKSLNGHILDSLGVDNPFAEGNDRPNGMTFDFEQSLDRAADADYFLVYSTPDAVAEALQDSRFQQFDALAAGRFATRTGDRFDECAATTYLNVDGLVRDYAIALAPDLFPGESGTCFEAWQGS